jgi:hypothetical protein
MPLISVEEPLPPRGDMRGYFTSVAFKPEVQFLSLKFDSKVNRPVVKSIIFANSLVEDRRERALIVNAPFLPSDLMVNFVLVFSKSSLLAG